MNWKHDKEKLTLFTETLNGIHSKIKFTAESSQNSIKFLDIKVSLIGSTLKQIYMSSLEMATNTLILSRVTFPIVRKTFRIVKHDSSTEFVLKIILLVFIVIILKNSEF